MSHRYFGAFLAALFLTAGFSVFFFPHGIDPNGDAVGYVDAMLALANPDGNGSLYLPKSWI